MAQGFSAEVSLSRFSQCIWFNLSYAGDDCLIIVWDLIQGIEFQVISILFNGPISALAWTPTSLDPISSFAFGCADGTLSVYCQVPMKVSPATLLISLHFPSFTLYLRIIMILLPLWPLMLDLLRTSISAWGANKSLPSEMAVWNCGWLIRMVSLFSHSL